MAHWIKKNEQIEKYQLGYTEGVKCGDYVPSPPPRVECMTCDSSVVLWHLMDADRRTR
jgi:hypothetical protein